jgi:hypothetical protein
MLPSRFFKHVGLFTGADMYKNGYPLPCDRHLFQACTILRPPEPLLAMLDL